MDYVKLVMGSGCPCCHENLMTGDEYTAENISAWQRSVEHLSEGKIEYAYATLNLPPLRVPLSEIYNPEA